MEQVVRRMILEGLDGETMTLDLDSRKLSFLNLRSRRSFCITCGQDKILSEIENADSYVQLEAVAKKYYICDACRFADVNLDGVKTILRAVVGTLYKYPRLRSRLCFIGTFHGLQELLERLMRDGDTEVLKAFDLRFICSKQDAVKLGTMISHILAKEIDHMTKEEEDGDATLLATAYSIFVFYFLLFDRNDYCGKAYGEFLLNIAQNEACGYHPKGCNTADSVVYHELGHFLSNLCRLEEDSEFKGFYSGLTTKQIEQGLSRYATTSPSEFLAEAFAEYMCNPSPRPIAAKIGKLIDSAYRRAESSDDFTQ